MLLPISVVIPAYNEAARIVSTLEATITYLQETSQGSELIVVDDGSTDATVRLARQVMIAHSGLTARVLDNPRNRGNGAAVRQGLLAAKEAIGVFFDADLSTPIDELPKIVEPVASGQADVTFGSRALNRNLIGNRQPWRREQAGIFYNFLVRFATDLPFWDTQCGFKAFRLEVCRPLIAASKIDGFGFDVELLVLAQCAGLKLREIPVRWNHHEGSKVHFLHDSLRMLREVAVLRRHVNSGKYGATVSASPLTSAQEYSTPREQ